MRAGAFVPTLALVFGAASCGLLRDYTTYRRLIAHERELAELEIVRYDLAVDLEEHAVHVTARVTFQNHGAEPVEEVRVLLHPEVELARASCDGRELEHELRLERIGDLAAMALELRGFEPIATEEQRVLELDYRLAPSEVRLDQRLEAEHGYLLHESLWVPMLRTPLSTSGMDRAPLVLDLTLPAPLEPAGVAEFELLRDEGATRTFRGTSTFPFAPFFAYGDFTDVASPDGSARIRALAEPSPRSAEFVLAALAELRAHFETAFGPVGLERTQVVIVRRFSSCWGAPGCILLDEGLWPRETWQEQGRFELLAHEFAHTWWGACVAMRGRGGYLHEGLANWCSADAVRARYGAEAQERAFEVWLARYAKDRKPLGRSLRGVSYLDRERYQRGAYLVGAHFYRALEQRLGRERFVALLARFHERFAFQSADLDDMVALAREMYGKELDDLFALWLDSRRGSDELHARGREMLATRGRHWREREPAPSAELRARVDAVLAQAVERAQGNDLAGKPPAERTALAVKLFGDLNVPHELQVTVVDPHGDLVYHVDGLTGSVLGHRDLSGSSVYGTLIADERSAGSFANFDATTEDLFAARENYGAWQKLGELALVVEGHFWRAVE